MHKRKFLSGPTSITDISFSMISGTEASLMWNSDYITRYGSIWERLVLYCTVDGLTDMSGCPAHQELDSDSFG